MLEIDVPLDIGERRVIKRMSESILTSGVPGFCFVFIFSRRSCSAFSCILCLARELPQRRFEGDGMTVMERERLTADYRWPPTPLSKLSKHLQNIAQFFPCKISVLIYKSRVLFLLVPQMFCLLHSGDVSILE